jgi:hypothetical protein
VTRSKGEPGRAGTGRRRATAGPTVEQRAWLMRALDQPGGKLPLFDHEGQRVDAALVRACVRAGWAAPWFENPLKPDWQVCRLTEAGRAVVADAPAIVSDVTVVIPALS